GRRKQADDHQKGAVAGGFRHGGFFRPGKLAIGLGRDRSHFLGRVRRFSGIGRFSSGIGQRLLRRSLSGPCRHPVSLRVSGGFPSLRLICRRLFRIIGRLFGGICHCDSRSGLGFQCRKAGKVLRFPLLPKVGVFRRRFRGRSALRFGVLRLKRFPHRPRQVRLGRGNLGAWTGFVLPLFQGFPAFFVGFLAGFCFGRFRRLGGRGFPREIEGRFKDPLLRRLGLGRLCPFDRRLRRSRSGTDGRLL